MSAKSVQKRIRVTRSGKVMRRAMALGHSRANKNSTQMKRKKGARGLNLPIEKVVRYL